MSRGALTIKDVTSAERLAMVQVCADGDLSKAYVPDLMFLSVKLGMPRCNHHVIILGTREQLKHAQLGFFCVVLRDQE